MLEASKERLALVAVAALLAAPVAAHAQRRQPATPNIETRTNPRPLPGPVIVPPAFTRAIASGTRTRTGEPGPRNWVQHARYAIDASIDPATNTLEGAERVRYINNSPDTLARLAIYLRQNVFRPESPRGGFAPRKKRKKEGRGGETG